MLPKPPPWKSRVVAVEGGTTKDPIVFFYRDALEVFRFLFANPLFADRQNNVPTKVWADFEKDIRILDEPSSGDLVFKIQVELYYLFTFAFCLMTRNVLGSGWRGRNIRIGHAELRQNPSLHKLWG